MGANRVSHDATSLLFLLRLLLKITLVYIYKNHMMRNRRRIMMEQNAESSLKDDSEYTL